MNVSTPITVLRDSFSTIDPVINQIVITILILLIGFIAGKLIGRLIQVGLKEIQLDKQIKRLIRFDLQLSKWVGSLVSYAIYAASIIIALARLKLMGYVMYVLLIVILVVFVMSILGFVKDFLPNVLAGIYLKKRGFFKPGDKILLPNIKGKIVSINWLETEIYTNGKDKVFIPNSVFSKQEFFVKK
ncbi:MAG: mechanosensitive ion channel family protein [Nanoarchaeota archaeon]|nr:mechanosensitive ion channel family protein [Nanoarchaeota archaeon]